VVLRGLGEDPTVLPLPIKPSSELPWEKEVEFDLGSEELRQIFGDDPASRKHKKSVSAPSVEEEDEDEGNFQFELGAWV
jgi:hypothetical protein